MVPVSLLTNVLLAGNRDNAYAWMVPRIAMANIGHALKSQVTSLRLTIARTSIFTVIRAFELRAASISIPHATAGKPQAPHADIPGGFDAPHEWHIH